jgi:hypothetical protein
VDLAEAEAPAPADAPLTEKITAHSVVLMRLWRDDLITAEQIEGARD